MRITLITLEQYDVLLSIYNDFPALTFQNTGYERINKNSLNDEDKSKIKEVEAILKQHISGFSSFQNFKTNNPDKILKIRFQYNYNADSENRNDLPFIGVGYVSLDTLLNGFEDNDGERTGSKK